MRKRDLAKANKLKTLFALDYNESEMGDYKSNESKSRPNGEGLAFEVCEVCGVPTDESYTEEDGRTVCTECVEL